MPSTPPGHGGAPDRCLTKGSTTHTPPSPRMSPSSAALRMATPTPWRPPWQSFTTQTSRHNSAATLLYCRFPGAQRCNRLPPASRGFTGRNHDYAPHVRLVRGHANGSSDASRTQTTEVSPEQHHNQAAGPRGGHPPHEPANITALVRSNRDKCRALIFLALGLEVGESCLVE